ncbi:MAG: MotA/TolQ/ExbB proton channel family protein [Methylotenera sp.]|nr:MotA/TolQ/ExbB proton channel family protein [Methylotenera sp.]
MQQSTEFDSLSFILQGGFVSISVAVILLMMSLASWYFIIAKTVQITTLNSAIKRYMAEFWLAPNLQTALENIKMDSPAHQLATNAVEAAQHHQTHAAGNLNESCSYDEFIARNMRRSLSHTTSQLESGLSVLASVGSVSPFVGLFGTVWGIYHALASISASGQATLDKVAGPVGEALIMTAIGLAVAIPAVLAYNTFVKKNRMIMASLDGFAQDLHTLLTTGAALAVRNHGAKNNGVKNDSVKNRHNIKVMPIQTVKSEGVPAW